MIRVLNLFKSYGQQPLFDDVSFLMNPGERLGLVGRNGHGKTTLFKILLGQERADAGEVIHPKHYEVGHLSQHLDFAEDNVLAEACSVLPESDDGTDLTYKAEAALQGLGFAQEQFQQSPSELSGGYQVRLNLAKVLVSEPNLLLLDEPTNYLDIVSMRWLEQFLRSWRREMMIITHDREFMDRVTTHTMAIHRGKLRKIEGKTHEIFEQIAQEEEIHEKTRQNQARDRKQQERFIERFRAKASKAKAVQSRIKMLERQESLDQLGQIQDLSFRFRHAPFPAKQILDVSELSFGYPSGPTLIEDFELNVGAEDRIAVIGRNGKGKTTLLSLVAGVLEPGKGRLRFHTSAEVAYFGQNNVERLSPEKTIEEEIIQAHPEQSRGAARGICGLMMFEGDDALKKVKVLSGGEKARVLLGKLLVSPCNLLLLDEPTNHLDMQSTESLMYALEEFPGAVIMVTHSEMILRRVATRLIVFDGGKVRAFEGTYEDFLDQVGWEEERAGNSTVVAEPVERGPSRKEKRRLRAEIVAERSRKLKPLKGKIEKVEAQIMEREDEASKVDAELVAASTQGDAEVIARLGKRSSELQAEIQQLFEELEQLTIDHDWQQHDFEKRLAELE